MKENLPQPGVAAVSGVEAKVFAKEGVEAADGVENNVGVAPPPKGVFKPPKRVEPLDSEKVC